MEPFKDFFHPVTGGLEKPGAFPLPPEGLKKGSNELRKESLQAAQHTGHAGQPGPTQGPKPFLMISAQF